MVEEDVNLTKENPMNSCTAIVEHRRIQFAINKDDEGYSEFAQVLEDINTNGYLSWYGDITDEKGKDRVGLIITTRPLDTESEDE